MAKKKEEPVAVKSEIFSNEEISLYSDISGVSPEEIVKFLEIGSNYSLLKEEDKKRIAELAKTFIQDEAEAAKKPQQTKKTTNTKASSDDVLVTEEGLRELKIRLYLIKNWKLPDCLDQVAAARAFGDLSENAEYDAARAEQNKTENERDELDFKIQHAVIIEKDSRNKNVIVFGDTVVVKALDDDEEETYTIIGTTEADPDQQKISNESPMGKALVGKKVGEIVDVNAPMGIIKYQILRKGN